MSETEIRGEIVAPGDELGKDLKSRDATAYMEDGVLKSSVMGLVNKKGNSIIPLSGVYLPKEGDMVIGVVERVLHNKYLLNIDSPYKVILEMPRRNDRRGGYNQRGGYDRQREETYVEGDILSVKITYVDEVKDSKGTGPRKLHGGRLLFINAKKVPRVIGNKKSMLTILRDKTGCRIAVGQNGLAWVSGDDEKINIVVDAILKIERESHTSGLTDRISEYLEEKLKNGR